jgi:hypothetical protein
LDFEIPVCNNSIIQIECLSGSILFALFIGSPFQIPVGEPPDPRKVHIYGPGIEDGLLHSYQSRFLVETLGAGAGQLAVRIKGPRGRLFIQYLLIGSPWRFGGVCAVHPFNFLCCFVLFCLC